MSVRNLMNADDTDIWQGFAHDDMVDCVVRSVVEQGRGVRDRCGSDDDEEPEPVMPWEAKLNSIAVPLCANESRTEIDLELQRRLRALGREIQRESSIGLGQARIDSYFRK